MTHYNTILHQIIALIPRHVFDRQAALHHSGQKFRSYNRWSQFMAMLIGQLSERKSLRDITALPPMLRYSSISIFNSLSFNKVIPFPLP